LNPKILGKAGNTTPDSSYQLLVTGGYRLLVDSQQRVTSNEQPAMSNQQ